MSVRVRGLLRCGIPIPSPAMIRLGGDQVAAVLKVLNHGSNSSGCEPILRAVNPQVAVVSVGADNRFGHPAPEVLSRYAERGIPVLRTDELGGIEFITDG